MSEPLDELYFRWLYEQVAVSKIRERDLTYWKVLKILFTTEFVWVNEVINDENRIHDGLALRSKFIEAEGIDDVDPDWLTQGCSVLELMVGLSRRMEFEADEGKAYYWFWVLMENIGLDGYSDDKRFTKRAITRVENILEDLIHRNYESSGLGGFFPLQDSHHDQRDRELWYQMNDYILERELAG
jgi:hypothetical protein